jgi:23S rRNA pseudouridine2605 synthase
VLGDRARPEPSGSPSTACPVATKAGLVYYLLNKPVGVVTTAHDPEGRRTVVDLVPAEPRVFPVGRLDYDSEGCSSSPTTATSPTSSRIPRFGVEKSYLVEVEGSPSPAAIRRLREGVDLDDGRTAPARGAPGPAGRRHTSALEVTIHEGRNRQVRRMCEAVGHPVRRLVRTRIGPVRDRRLGPGAWRDLTPREVQGLYTAARHLARGPRPPRSNLACRESGGLRGAITCTEDTKAEIEAKTQRLVKEMLARNDVAGDDLVSIMVTATDDLTAAYPASAIRRPRLRRRAAARRPRARGRRRAAALRARARALLQRAVAAGSGARLPRGRAQPAHRPPRVTEPSP